MRYLILLLASLLLIACNENEATKRLVIAFITVQSTAEAKVKTVDDLQKAGKITPDEAESFKKWTEPLIQASRDAVGIVADETIPFDARVTKALSIYVDAQRLAVFESSNNQALLASYIAVSNALLALEIHLNYAQAKAGLEKTQ